MGQMDSEMNRPSPGATYDWLSPATDLTPVAIGELHDPFDDREEAPGCD